MYSKKIIVSVLALLMFVNTNHGMNLTARTKIEECPNCFEEAICYVSLCCPNDIMCPECRMGFISANVNDKKVPHCPDRNCTREIDQKAKTPFKYDNNDVEVIFKNAKKQLRQRLEQVTEKKQIEDINKNLKEISPLRKRYYAFLDEKWKRENGIKPCPTPDCQAEFESQNGELSYKCLSCRKNYCPRCEFDHRGITCDIAQAIPRKCVDCNETHAPRLTCEEAKQNHTYGKELKGLQGKNVQRCPRCRAGLEKTDGCNYMTCGQCRYEFCWLCLGPGRNHRCINNGCGIWEPDHGRLTQQLEDIERQMARANIIERAGLARQKADVEGQQARIEGLRAGVEERRAREAALLKQIKNNIIVGSFFAASGSYALYTIYNTWNQKRKFSLIAQAAEQAVEKILEIEFELFDEGNSLLMLQEQFDIVSLQRLIKSDEKRDAFKAAIEAYDLSFKAVYDSISSTKYYHQTPEYFAQHESGLIQKLYSDLDALKQTILSCQSDIGTSWKKLLGVSGLVTCAAAGSTWYYFNNLG